MGLTADKTQLERFCDLEDGTVENIKTQAQDLKKKKKLEHKRHIEHNTNF